MKHSGSFAIKQGRASVFVAPSKFDQDERYEPKGLSNREVNQLISGRRVVEIVGIGVEIRR